MSAGRRRTVRDRRRRELGQNFLADTRFIDQILQTAAVQPDELIVEIGAGRGALTLPLARAGGRVVAIEPDPVWAKRLRRALDEAGLAGRVRVVVTGFQRFVLPSEPYRIVANPPFNQTTALLARLLDDPARGPWRADLVIQREVARKHATEPPTSLRTASWAPWWSFEHQFKIRRDAFRPVPAVDAALLTVLRRSPPVLPEWLAPELRELLRPGWKPPTPPDGRPERR